MTIRPIPSFFRPEVIIEIMSNTSYAFTIPTHDTGGTYAMYVDWGDGSPIEYIDNDWQSNLSHNYAINDIFQIKLTGICTHLELGAPPRNREMVQRILRCADLGFTVLSFGGCGNLTYIPEELKLLKHLTTINNMFTQCGSLTSVPEDIFNGCSAITQANEVFSYSGLTTIPTNLFKPLVNVTQFNSTFNDCSMLVSIPSGLFDYNTLVTQCAGTFANCGSLEAIPVDLFRNMPALEFANSLFLECSSLTTLPADIFRYNTAITDFSAAFYQCGALATLPDNLFKYNTSCLDFSQVFKECASLQLKANIFYGTGEQSTRFLNQSIDFNSCFSRDYFYGVQGVAPDLWNCNFGTGTPIKNYCFDGDGNSLDSVTNYSSIPTDWKTI